MWPQAGASGRAKLTHSARAVLLRFGTRNLIPVTNAIERLHEEFKRRIKTQTVLPSAETAAMLFWALLASGQITMRKVDGWKSIADKPSDQTIDQAESSDNLMQPEDASGNSNTLRYGTHKATCSFL